jgi:sugar lactone lactonase YvrE
MDVIVRDTMDMRPAVLSVFLVCMPAEAPAQTDRAALQEAVAKARAAHDAGDRAGFRDWSARAVTLAPRSTRALYDLACAHALLGDLPAATALLDRLTRMGVATDAARDKDFDGIRARPAFAAVLERARALEARLGSSETAFTLGEKDLVTEGVAYDPASRAFFVSSVRKRKVVRRAADGRVSDFTKASDGLFSAVGLAVDAGRRSLWLTTAAIPQMEGFAKVDEGRSFLVEYDLDTGSVRRRLGPPAGLERATLSDLAVGPQGGVFVADPVTGRVYVLRRGEAALRVLTEAGAIGSAQGLATRPDGRALFVADYTQGIVRVDPVTGATKLLPVPEDAAVTGIDGLVFHGGHLIGVQNGVRPHRVVRLRLDPAGDRVTAVETLERNHPAFDEPTLATVVDDVLYYVANSQYARVRDDGTLETDRLHEPTVLRLRLAR